jgi:hypothetical protein
VNTALFVTAAVLVSLVLWLAAIVLRQAREERARATARVHALRSVALADAAAAPTHDLPLAVEPEAAGTRAALGTVRMFGAADEPAAPSRRWIALAAVGSAMAIVLTATFALGTSETAPAPATSGASRAPAGVPATRPTEPLALVALEHSLDRRGRLTITGVVSNPAAGDRLDAVVSVITVFDRQGQPLVTRTAPVAIAPLAPDAQAPFAATIAGVRGISRFTVAFQSADGRAIPHVDRRAVLQGAMQ